MLLNLLSILLSSTTLVQSYTVVSNTATEPPILNGSSLAKHPKYVHQSISVHNGEELMATNLIAAVGKAFFIGLRPGAQCPAPYTSPNDCSHWSNDTLISCLEKDAKIGCQLGTFCDEQGCPELYVDSVTGLLRYISTYDLYLPKPSGYYKSFILKDNDGVGTLTVDLWGDAERTGFRTCMPSNGKLMIQAKPNSTTEWAGIQCAQSQEIVIDTKGIQKMMYFNP